MKIQDFIGNGVRGAKFTSNGDVLIWKTASMGPTELVCKEVTQCSNCLWYWELTTKKCHNCNKSL